ncbi:MAG: glycosyl transferase family 1 [Bacteroidia bacterium]|nr:MAG: glycosyl transferase family 1 [Bacteroidia bacterium]
MKLKVVILIDWFLPGDKAGGPVRSVYSLIKALQDKIDFYVITMNTDIFSDKEYSVIPNKWTKYEDINVFYFSKHYFNSKNLIAVIKEKHPDVLYINSFWSFRFSILPLLLKKLGKLDYSILLSPRGMLDAGALNIKSFKKIVFIFLSKLIGLHNGIIFHATSEEEKKSIKRIFKNSDVHLVSNLSIIEGNWVENVKKKDELKLFFLSRISEVKNLDFAIRVLSDISLSNNQKIKYHIYGNNEEKEYFKLCKELAKQLPSQIEYQYKGGLSFHEVPFMIANYHALFLPTKNENFGHAIVETLSCGRPVIISNCTPWNDVNAYNCGFALELKEENFKDVILKFLEMDNLEFQEMCKNARAYIDKKLNKEFIISEYIKLFNYAAKSKIN